MAKDIKRAPKSNFSGKQKKALLQQARRKDPRPELEEERVPKVVQARLYPFRLERGGEVHVRMRLAIDRQLCRGFVPGKAGKAGSSEPDLPSTEPASRASPTVQRLIDRTATMRTSLSRGGADCSKWLHALEDCTALAGAFAEAAGEAGTSLRAADLFGLLQQALQTGPLQCSKPARFKRLLGTGASSEHANAVRRLLEAVAAMCLGEGAAAFTERQRDAIAQWQAQFARTVPELGAEC